MQSRAEICTKQIMKIDSTALVLLVKLVGQVIQQIVDYERSRLGLNHAGIELGDIHQCADQRLDVLQ